MTTTCKIVDRWATATTKGVTLECGQYLRGDYPGIGTLVRHEHAE